MENFNKKFEELIAKNKYRLNCDSIWRKIGEKLTKLCLAFHRGLFGLAEVRMLPLVYAQNYVIILQLNDVIKTASSQRSFYYCTVILWNSLETSLKLKPRLHYAQFWYGTDKIGTRTTTFLVLGQPI